MSEGASEARRTAGRKADHLRINLGEDVGGALGPGFDRYRFDHLALPDLDLAEVSTEAVLFGRRLGAPLLISCMTGGVEAAVAINRRLAEVAQAHGLALGLGSGRVLLESPGARAGFDVRRLAPDVPLLANLGAVQLNLGVGVDGCRRLVDLLEADALVLHLNPLQEALQPEGRAGFRGLLGRIEAVCAGLGRPVVVKEVGWGLAADVVRDLLEAGVAAVDVAGAGGTSWSEVERHRLQGPRARVAAAFRGWGIPTAEALVQARRAAPQALVFASGGIRDGMDAALAIGLGADIAGLAGPFLRAAAGGEAAAHHLAEELIGVLRTVMFCVGAPDLGAFRARPRLVERVGR